MCGAVQKVAWSGTVLWDFVYSTTGYCSHHDIHQMPNGNVLLIAYERKTAAQVTAAGCSQSIEMWPEKIVEIQPSGTNGGTIVWEWHVWDHLCQNYNAAKANYVTSIEQHPELININYLTQKDWMHANGIDYNEALDQITFSSHNLNEVYVIDHSTTTAQAASHAGGNSGQGGDILYRWGNPGAYQATGTTIFNVVHDAHWISADHPTYPNLLCAFNNRGGTGLKSCSDIFSPPYSGYNYSITPGQAFLPSSYTWRHTYSGTASQNEGSSQQLPNGNTLMCIANSGFIYEINTNQTQVWSKQVPGQVPQSFRYPACYVTGTYTASPTATPSSVSPGSSVQLDVTATGGVVYLYAWSSSPAGFTSTLQNPVVTPTVTTVYTVIIKNGPCTATNMVTVTVTPPQIPVTLTLPNHTVTGEESSCFNAQQTISAGGSGTGFVVEAGGSATLITGQNILFVPNVLVQPSGYLRAYITTTGTYCATGSDAIIATTGKPLPGAAGTEKSFFTVYPNPAGNYLTFALQDGLPPAITHIQVLSIDGKEVLKEVIDGLSKKELSLQCLSRGIYFIRVIREDRSGSVKIIKE
jgi:hypothetical protein